MEVPVCRVHWIAVTDERGKTVRSPPVPSAKVGVGAWLFRICLRIFFEIASMLWVVKRLAAATCDGSAPAKNDAPSAKSNCVRYALSAAGPRASSSRQKAEPSSRCPSEPRTPRVTISRYLECCWSCSSLSTCSVFAAGSQTTWLIPTRRWCGPMRNTVWLDTVVRSIGPENGIEIRGWMLKPSSVLRTSISAQSDGLTAQSGFGRSTRRPVTCVRSQVVKRLLGNGWPALTAASAVPGTTSESAIRAAANSERMGPPIPWTRRGRF